MELLLADGRRSINELAAAVNVSRASAYQRLDRLKVEGVLKGFTAVVDEAKVGLPIIVLVLINADQRRWREVRDELLLMPGLEQLGLNPEAFDFGQVRLAAVEERRDVVLDGSTARGDSRHPDRIMLEHTTGARVSRACEGRGREQETEAGSVPRPTPRWTLPFTRRRMSLTAGVMLDPTVCAHAP